MRGWALAILLGLVPASIETKTARRRGVHCIGLICLLDSLRYLLLKYPNFEGERAKRPSGVDLPIANDDSSSYPWTL